MYDEFWPEFFHFELETGSRRLLLPLGLAESLNKEDLAGLLALPAEEVLPAIYRQAHALPDCGALLVAAVADGEDERAAG